MSMIIPASKATYSSVYDLGVKKEADKPVTDDISRQLARALKDSDNTAWLLEKFDEVNKLWQEKHPTEEIPEAILGTQATYKEIGEQINNLLGKTNDFLDRFLVSNSDDIQLFNEVLPEIKQLQEDVQSTYLLLHSLWIEVENMDVVKGIRTPGPLEVESVRERLSDLKEQLDLLESKLRRDNVCHERLQKYIDIGQTMPESLPKEILQSIPSLGNVKLNEAERFEVLREAHQILITRNMLNEWSGMMHLFNKRQLSQFMTYLNRLDQAQDDLCHRAQKLQHGKSYTITDFKDETTRHQLGHMRKIAARILPFDPNRALTRPSADELKGTGLNGFNEAVEGLDWISVRFPDNGALIDVLKNASLEFCSQVVAAHSLGIQPDVACGSEWLSEVFDWTQEEDISPFELYSHLERIYSLTKKAEKACRDEIARREAIANSGRSDLAIDASPSLQPNTAAFGLDDISTNLQLDAKEQDYSDEKFNPLGNNDNEITSAYQQQQRYMSTLTNVHYVDDLADVWSLPQPRPSLFAIEDDKDDMKIDAPQTPPSNALNGTGNLPSGLHQSTTSLIGTEAVFTEIGNDEDHEILLEDWDEAASQGSDVEKTTDEENEEKLIVETPTKQ